jgi:hypothetical protein
MRRNVRWWDRGFRYVLGVVMLAWAIAGGPWWTLIGLFPLATASWAFCPVLWLLKVAPAD